MPAQGPIAQLAEAEDLKSLCSGFESRWGYKNGEYVKRKAQAYSLFCSLAFKIATDVAILAS